MPLRSYTAGGVHNTIGQYQANPLPTVISSVEANTVKCNLNGFITVKPN